MKKVARNTLRVVIAFGLACAGLLAIRAAIRHMACGDEETLKVEEISGMRFDVTYLSCDTLAKDEAIRVYAETATSRELWILGKWGNRRTLLFRYDPGRYDSTLPSITHPSASTILISVPEVSEINYQNHNWAGMTIDYKIGRVIYQESSK